MNPTDSLAKWYKRTLKDRFKSARRFLRRLFTAPGSVIEHARFRSAIQRRDWASARRSMTVLAEGAISGADIRLLKDLSEAAGRFGDHESSTSWAMEANRLSQRLDPASWNGASLRGASLLVHFMESTKQGLSQGVNMSGYLLEAKKEAEACVLVVEKRMVPLFQRTLPGVHVIPFPEEPAAAPGTRVVTANPLILRNALGTAPERIEQLFHPLAVNTDLRDSLRERYLRGRPLPLIGISWWSSHHGKDLPPKEEWLEFMRNFPAIFVSLQYGDIEKETQFFERELMDRFICDPEIDQLRDMDSFASQLAAMDAIITISNTGAHLAGAIRAPTFLIRDDWFRRGWPVLSQTTPWYPAMRVFGKDGNPWRHVFERIQSALEKYPSKPPQPGNHMR